jgi:hypothetical protein
MTPSSVVIHSYIRFDKDRSNQVFYELKYPTVIKRKRPGESRRSKLVRRSRVTKEVKKQEGEGRLCSRVTASKPPDDLSMKSTAEEVPSYVGRYLLGRGPKYIPIRDSSDRKLKKPLSTAPRSRSHNYRRKALITSTNIKNCNKNKSSSSGSNFKSDIYHFSILFSNNPVSLGMSIHALSSPSSKRTKVKIKKTLLCVSNIARLSYRRSIIEHELCKILYQHQQKGRLNSNLTLFTRE